MSASRWQRGTQAISGFGGSQLARPPRQLVRPAVRPDDVVWNPITTLPWVWVIWAESNAGHGSQSWTPPADGGNANSWTRLDVTGGSFGGHGTYRAMVAALNNRAAVQLTGTISVSYYETFTASATAQPFTLVTVWNYASLTGGGWMFNAPPFGTGAIGWGTTGGGAGWQINWGTGGGTAHLGGTPTTGGHFAVAEASGATSRLTVDGSTVVGPVSAGTASTTLDHILASFNGNQYNLTGHIAFAGLLGRALTATEEATLLAWSRSYYATP